MFGFRAAHGIRHLKFLLGMFLFVKISDRCFVSWTRDEMIREGIAEKKLLAFKYDGLYRVVEPHVYGRKNDKNGILVYQVEGQSSTGKLGWKRMYVNKITSMSVLDDTFPGIRPVPNEHSTWDFRYFIVD